MRSSVGDLTAEQLQHILSVLQANGNEPGPSEDPQTWGKPQSSTPTGGVVVVVSLLTVTPTIKPLQCITHVFI